MDTTPLGAGRLDRTVLVTLHRGDWCLRPVEAELSYDDSDPYAITMTVRLHGHSLPWIFARSLLSGGLTAPTGDGDVHVWPVTDDHGHALVAIELSSLYGQALVEMHADDAVAFIARTNTIVEPGHESEHLDIDATVTAIRAADPG